MARDSSHIGLDTLFNTLWEYGLDTGDVCEWILSATGMKRGVSCRTKKNIHQLFTNQLNQHLLFHIFFTCWKQRCFFYVFQGTVTSFSIVFMLASRHEWPRVACSHCSQAACWVTERHPSAPGMGKVSTQSSKQSSKEFKTVLKTSHIIKSCSI